MSTPTDDPFRQPDPYRAATAAGALSERLRRPATISWASTLRIGLAVFVGSALALLLFGLGVRWYVGHQVAEVGDSLSESFGELGDLDDGGAATGSAISVECDAQLQAIVGLPLSTIPDDCRAADAADHDLLMSRMGELGITYTGG